MTPLEAVAVLAGLGCVWLTIRQSVWCWPVGLVQVSLYVVIFYRARLYSDVLLHVVYVGLQFYGWNRWLRGGRGGEPLPVTRLTSAGAATWLGVGAAGTAALGLATASLTDASLPYWDAAIAAFSLVAQYLMARKILENWLVWMAVDVVAVGVYSAKELFLTAGLYGVFLGLCAAGWLAWRRTLPGRGPA